MDSLRRLTMAGLLGVPALLLAGPMTIGPETKSTLTAAFKQEGVAVENPFLRWSGRIDYDPKNAAAATAEFEVQMDSYDMFDPAYTAELAKKSWFDTATYPKGTFRSTSIKPVSATRLEATGTLTLKGKAQTVSFPVTVTSGAGGTVFDGSFAISRKAFGIGDPIWEDALEDQVTIKFHLVGGR